MHTDSSSRPLGHPHVAPRVVALLAFAALVSASLLAAAVTSPLAPARAIDDTTSSLKEAERLFAEQSYKPARELYLQLAEEPTDEIRGQVLTRLAECHERLRDRRALRRLREADPPVLEFPWNARYLRILGRVDGQNRGGWQKTGRLNQALELFEEHGQSYRGEWADTAFDLIEAVSTRWRYDIDRSEWEKEYHRDDPEEIELPFEVWSTRKGREQDEARRERVLALYESLLERSVDVERNARALLERGMFRLTSIGDPLGQDNFALPTVKEFIEGLTEDPEETLRREAIAEWLHRAQEAVSDWRLLLDRYPNDGRADDASFLTAHVTESYFNDLVRAVQLYRATLRDYPESQWTGNCQSRLDAIQRESIQLSGAKVHPPDLAPVYSLNARNVKRVMCRLYPIDSLTDYLSPGQHLEPGATVIDDDADHISWQVETGCTDDHKLRSVEIVVPEKRAGSYLLRVSGDKSRVETLVVLSNLALTLESGEEEAVAWVTSAVTGSPRAGVPVLIRLDGRQGRTWSHTTKRLTTDAQGLVRLKYPTEFQPGQGVSGVHVSAVAEDSRHGALASHTSNWPDSDRSPRWVYYLETDRPAYRPGQTVHFKLTMRHWSGESYVTPKAGIHFQLKINDPRRQAVLNENVETDAQGVITRSITLPSDASLGMYQIKLEQSGERISPRKWDRRAFRVEEYRRPEFEVTISSPDEPVIIGDALSVEVSARFLAGDPVRAGKVKVRVTRLPYEFRYEPPTRFPWFSSPRNEHSYWDEEEVFSADGILDGQGQATFAIPTSAFPDGLDSRYQVSAWVTDAAQREQTSTTALPVTKTEFFAHLQPRLRIYAPGESVEIDVRTLRPDQRGIASSGTVEIARRRDRIDSKDGISFTVTEWEKILELPFDTTDDVTRFQEPMDEQGQFQITYRTTDRRDNPVEGRTHVWVMGPEFTARDYRLEGLEIMASAREYTLGETAQIAIFTQDADAEILVIRSGGSRILDVASVRAQGNVAQLTLPITEAETPNLYLSAWTVRDRELRQARTELIVPPVHQILDGKLLANVPEVQPGGEVELELVVRDRHGNPVAGQFSLTLFDRALLFIQPEITLDPEKHFYDRKWDFNLDHALSMSYVAPTHFAWNSGEEPLDYSLRRLPSRLTSSWRYRFQYLTGAYGSYVWNGRKTPLDFEKRLSLGEDSARSLSSVEGKKSKRRSRGAVPATSAGILDLGDDSESEDEIGEAFDFDAGAGDSAAPVRTRSNFSETAVWKTDFTTGTDGRATCRVVMPDSLTSWQGIARGITRDGRVMHARVEVRTSKQILARLATPRFFRERDEVVVAALARNNFPEAVAGEMIVSFSSHTLEYRGDQRTRREGDRTSLAIAVTIPSEGEAKLDLPLRVIGHGPTEITLAVKTPRESDALIRKLPALPYGLDRYLGGAGIAADLDGVSESQWQFQIPEESVAASRSLVVDLTPSPAIALIECLPYLVRYPYGCVEQTLHRFLPAAVVAKTLESTGVDLAEILPERAAEIPSGYWGHLTQRPLELFRPEDLQRLLREGSSRLAKQQNRDGSWGWWAGSPGDPYITALVVDAYATAIEAGVDISHRPAQRGGQWLLNHLRSRDLRGENQIYQRPAFEEFAMIGRAIFRIQAVAPIDNADDTTDLRQLADVLYEFRDRLGAQGKALLATGLAALDVPDDERPLILLRNLENHEVRKDQWGTTHYGSPRTYLRWYDSGVEATARALEAFLAIAPEDERVPEMIRWLLENREGSHYDSTRSTAVVAFALARYLKQSGELDPELTAEVSLDGEPLASFEIGRKDIFTRRFRVEVPAQALYAGEHELVVRRTGRGNLYWSAGVSFYSQEDPIPAGGNRLALTRRYFRIVEKKSEREETFIVNQKQQTRKVLHWTRELEPLTDDSVLRAGDRVLVEVDVESANQFRYLIFEDRKPAGLEAVAVRSGYVGGVFGYRELRDDRVVHFSSRLPEGKHGFAYELRAERPGRFRALPVTGYAMYIPHVQANSDGNRLQVEP